MEEIRLGLASPELRKKKTKNSFLQLDSRKGEVDVEEGKLVPGQAKAWPASSWLG